LPRTAIHGSTRWINDTPVIQMSGRWRRNDVFWFTFFHEIGHILLHGKKYISLEFNKKDIKYSGEIEEFENQADSFASEWLLSGDEEEEIINHDTLNDDIILEYAKKFSTHPAIIIGRLHHKEIISYKYGRDFFESLNFNNKT
jgi:Zn-dependent peptidase ImmA (M78 family)